jgi:xylulokinase
LPADLTGGPDFDTLKAEAAEMPLGAETAGAALPGRRAYAGLVAGLTLRHNRAHLFRAACEGIAFGIRQILDLFDESASHVTHTVAVGGGVSSPLLTSIVTDVTGHTQLIPRETIGACYAALCLRRSVLGSWIPNRLDRNRPQGGA